MARREAVEAQLSRLDAMSIPGDLDLSAEEIDDLRERGRADLFTFSREILQYTKLEEEIHGPICALLEDHSAKRKLILMPRLSYKSTLCSIAYPLFVLCQDRPIIDDVYGFDARILLASSTDTLARGFLRELAAHIERNPIFRACYGDLRDSSKWSESQKTISKRKRHFKESSLSAYGKNSQLTSQHQLIQVIDDLPNEMDQVSDIERQKSIDWFERAQMLLEPNGVSVLVGTPQHSSDLYAHVQNLNTQLLLQGQEPWAIHRKPAYDEKGKAAFASIGLDGKRLERIKSEVGSLKFSSNYLLTPISSDSLLFPPESLEYFDQLPEKLEYYGFCDLALGKSAKSDFTAITTLGRDPESGDVFLVDWDLSRRSVGATRAAIVAKFRQFRYKRFGVEEQGPEAEVWNNLEADLSREWRPYKLDRVRHAGNKVARIQSAEPSILKVKFPSNWREICPEGFRQLTEFPFSRFDDACDSLEACLQLLEKRSNKEIRLRACEATGSQTRQSAFVEAMSQSRREFDINMNF